MASDMVSKLRYSVVAASEAKNQFGQVLESALRDGGVVITKHDMPKAILLSIEELEAIAARGRLDTLAREFDAKYLQHAGAGIRQGRRVRVRRAAEEARRRRLQGRPQEVAHVDLRARGAEWRRQEQYRRRDDPRDGRRLFRSRRGGAEDRGGQCRCDHGRGEQRGVARGPALARARDRGARQLRVRDHARRHDDPDAARTRDRRRRSMSTSGTSHSTVPSSTSHASRRASPAVATTSPSTTCAGATTRAART